MKRRHLSPLLSSTPYHIPATPKYSIIHLPQCAEQHVAADARGSRARTGCRLLQGPSSHAWSPNMTEWKQRDERTGSQLSVSVHTSIGNISPAITDFSVVEVPGAA